MLESGGYLVDSNVLLDIVTEDSNWFTWSSSALADAARRSPLFINPLIYSEVSTRFRDIDALDRLLPPRVLRRATLPYPAGFLAGKAFEAYRRRGGQRRSPLPDFYIGAHAVVSGLTLLTRDARRYATYFPTIRLRTP
ncbi:MAG: DNA-binding protein [Rhodoglobus sp.]|jgi:predicted nucleic acid-binding protein|nr:DNA-binding protein [Rhodoglobus sp.]